MSTPSFHRVETIWRKGFPTGLAFHFPPYSHGFNRLSHTQCWGIPTSSPYHHSADTVQGNPNKELALQLLYHSAGQGNPIPISQPNLKT